MWKAVCVHACVTETFICWNPSAAAVHEVLCEVHPYAAKVAWTCALMLIQRKPRGSSFPSCTLIISARPREICARAWGPWLGDRMYMQTEASMMLRSLFFPEGAMQQRLWVVGEDKHGADGRTRPHCCRAGVGWCTAPQKLSFSSPVCKNVKNKLCKYARKNDTFVFLC